VFRRILFVSPVRKPRVFALFIGGRKGVVLDACEDTVSSFQDVLLNGTIDKTTDKPVVLDTYSRYLRTP
jgi:hypothetical protein